MRQIMLILALILLPQLAAAQVAPYNPYAPSMDDALPAVSPEGKLHWPSFFRSAKTEAKYQSYFEQGSCVGTRKAVTALLEGNKVNVNTLPEVKLDGRAVVVKPGVLLMIDSQRHSCALLTHPANVTKINVSGTLPLSSVRPGMIVRLVARVDSSGRGLDVIDEMEIVNGNVDMTENEVLPDKLQTIVGTITRASKNLLQLHVAPGKLRRITLMIADDTKVSVNSQSLDLVAPGSVVTVEGHVYEGAGSLAQKTIFASHIDAVVSIATDRIGNGPDAQSHVAAEKP